MVRIRCFLDALFLKSVDLQGQALRSLRCCAKDAHCKRWSREIEFYAEHKICFASIELAAPFQTCWTSHSFRCLDIKVIACIHVCFLDASNFKTAQILSCPGIHQVSFKQPYVRQQRLDGSGPEACCSCTRVHGNQRRRLAKLLRPQFGHGCSLCNGAGLCSAPGEALSNPSRLLQKNPWVSAVSVFSFRAFTRWKFTPQWVLQIFGFAPSPFCWPVCWCLCLPSFSQFTVAPCHVLITSGLFVCLWGVFTTNVAEIHRFACSLYSLFESCKCLVLGKVVNVSVVTNAEDLQVNLLQSFCFLCLALATLSFHYGWVWSSRAAFALPFVVTAVQGLRPDSAETLALRLWQDTDDTDEFGWKFREWLNSSSP